jgi:glycosyltransferase involved in cell wall biosynthesis
MIVYTDYAGDTRVRREAEALVARGDVVHVLCPQPEERKHLTALNGVKIVRQGRIDYRERGPVGYLLKYLNFFLRASFTAFRLHLRNRYDVVQVHTMPDFLVFAALLPKLLGAKVLLDVHDLVPELYATKFGRTESHPAIRFLTWVERRSVAFADRALAVHEPHLDALVRHGCPRDRFTVVMNAPDPALFERQAAPPNGRFCLVYHGTVARRHGLEVAIRAIDLARQTHPDIAMKIVGDGDDIERIAGLVSERGLEDHVEVRRGFVPVEELRPILADATVGLVPLVADPFTRYMLPVKLLEYVALGIPAICTRTSTVAAYFDDDAIAFFESGDAEELARRIVDLRGDPERRRRMVVASQRFLDVHSWPREQQRYYDVIDGLVSPRRESAPGESRTADSKGGSYA